MAGLVGRDVIDAEIAKVIACKDVRAVRLLLTQYGPGLGRKLRSKGLSPEAIHRSLSDTAVETIQRYDPARGSVRALFFCIGANKFVDHVREVARTRRVVIPISEVEAKDLSAYPSVADAIIAEEEMEDKWARVQRGLESLTEKQRSAVFEGLGLRGLADGHPKSRTLRKNQSLALEKLRQFVESDIAKSAKGASRDAKYRA